MGRYWEIAGWLAVVGGAIWLSTQASRDSTARSGQRVAATVAGDAGETGAPGGGLGEQRVYRPRIPQGETPEALLVAVAQQLFYGPPETGTGAGEVDLAVASGHAKFLRGQATRVQLRGAFAHLGQGSGMATTKVWAGEDPAIEVGVHSQTWAAIQSCAGRPDVAPVVSTQPPWMSRTDEAEGLGSVAAYGSAIGLLQWLPHHFALEWWTNDETASVGPVQQSIQRRLPAGASLFSPAQLEPSGWQIVGVARRGMGDALATPAGAAAEASSVGGIRGVMLPAPQWVAIRFAALPGGQVRPQQIKFYRLHPLHDRAELLLAWEWQEWLPAPDLRPTDVQWAEKP
jgi:hypothetical protein